jgi:hypothetical protein
MQIAWIGLAPSVGMVMWTESHVDRPAPVVSFEACHGIQEAEGKDEPPARCAFKGAPEEEGSTPAPVCSARVDDLRAYVCRPLGQEGRTNLVSQSASTSLKQHKSTPSYISVIEAEWPLGVGGAVLCGAGAGAGELPQPHFSTVHGQMGRAWRPPGQGRRQAATRCLHALGQGKSSHRLSEE